MLQGLTISAYPERLYLGFIMLTLSLIVSAALAGNTIQIEDSRNYVDDPHGIASHYDEDLNKTYQCDKIKSVDNNFAVCFVPEKKLYILYVE